MKSITITSEASFEKEVLKATEPVIVDFWAEWCGPCKMLAPILEEVAAEQVVKIVKVNVDENPALAKHYRITSIPTLLYFSNGFIWDQTVGVTSKQTILSKLKTLPQPKHRKLSDQHDGHPA